MVLCKAVLGNWDSPLPAQDEHPEMRTKKRGPCLWGFAPAVTEWGWEGSGRAQEAVSDGPAETPTSLCAARLPGFPMAMTMSLFSCIHPHDSGTGHSGGDKVSRAVVGPWEQTLPSPLLLGGDGCRQGHFLLPQLTPVYPGALSPCPALRMCWALPPLSASLASLLHQEQVRNTLRSGSDTPPVQGGLQVGGASRFYDLRSPVRKREENHKYKFR